MALYEISTVILIGLLATATVAAIYIGLFGLMGAAYMVRCANCHHLTLTSSRQSPQACVHCRHPALLHPVYTLHHHTVPVHRDGLRY
ncbi:Uncharacterised protein [Mycolicibacterium phlei]|jgi:hypothetical protein|uniref:Uncharacterized protein n=1 Tax=Mycolicibacterium phlei DSM 43239 = CCUG 21000 TaxID=1226750 RepID=A0A5N5USD0_MYCPH|nr:DUF2614 family zinc ribbon-containing protein [Mycolicibacterium phlei]VEG10973.1 Uncharacterised protein [Mycobacteroides chelonae]AMO62873.1 hypothetical protein MPHLCCUG_04085 [Mycolicibacterium phlei]EID13062.1 hypothetical protein MPHLEI_15276 [Mycolicibacterium phlei RIVM601174]KAB7752017.1 hypothetical protein MPHL21000_22815 [Mycolicibacterium phlei DSM 43239 = CCUG 21000]KXW59525.1 hypothetical protein MPHL43072_12920 [Mycolicibacterium phlei DSM 43072]